MTTFSEFVSSPELEKMIGDKKYPKYKIKFSKIIKKAGIGDSDITDQKASAKLITGFSSWNWYGFFFGPFWAVFCKMKMGWFAFAAMLIVFLIEDAGVISTTTPFSSIGSTIVFLYFAIYGNSSYFAEIITKYNAGYKDRMPTSILYIFILIAASVAHAFISEYFFPTEVWIPATQ